MKHLITFLLALLLGHSIYSQVVFEEGYFVDNTGSRIECQIKNREWTINPETFEYKTGTDDVFTGSMQNVKEFGVGNVKFIRAIVDIDMSGVSSSSINQNKEMEFVRDTIFVQSLIEGQASLYSYTIRNANIFLFKVGDSEIKQLAYKLYLYDDTRVVENNKYKIQIQGNLQCSSIPITEIQKLRYVKKDLLNYFIKYNVCVGAPFVFSTEQRSPGTLSFAIKAGAISTELEATNTFFETDLQSSYPRVSNSRVGLELEYNLPIKNNKWSLIFDMTYSSISSQGNIDGILAVMISASNYDTYLINSNSNYTYSYLQLPLPASLRHYFFITDNSRIFVNTGIFLNIPLNSKITIEDQLLADVQLRAMAIYKFGLGYSHRNKMTFELSSELGRKMSVEYTDNNPGDGQHWDVRNQTVSFLIGYKLFSSKSKE